MKINRLVFLSALVILVSACTTKKLPDDPDYKIYSLDKGGAIIDVVEDKKTLNIGLSTRGSTSFMNMRDRKDNDVYEQICIARKPANKPELKLVTCINEKGAKIESVYQEDQIFTKDEVAKGIEKISLNKGLKLDKFSFNLDGTQKTEYTTRKFEGSEQPESYTVIRLLSNKNVWSGQKMLIIKEN